jgi:hypothetical protein
MTSPLERLERVMGGYPENNPPASFPRTTRKGHGKDAIGETPRLGVTKGIALRMPDSFPRMTRKGYGKDIKARNFSVNPTPRARKNRQPPGID